MELVTVETQGPGLYEITAEAAARASGDGVLTLFVRHTSCSLLIQENAAPDVQADLLAFFARLVPPADHPSMNYLTHVSEGPDDMPAHIKASLLPVSLQIPSRAAVSPSEHGRAYTFSNIAPVRTGARWRCG